jgi:hypothetical protein
LDVLNSYANLLRFVADDLNDHGFSCTSHNVLSQGADILPIRGTISQYLPADGKTALSTSANSNDVFFRPGCSGSPVYSESLNGIAGIVDQLIDSGNGRFAFMIDSRRLGELIPDIIVHQPSIKKKNRLNNRFLCDRQEVIEGILNEKVRNNQGNLFFLWGNDEQEGKAFSNRYDIEIIRPSNPENSLISIEVDLSSGIFNPERFKTFLLDKVSSIAYDQNKKLELKPEDDILTAYKSLKLVKHKIFFFKVLDYQPEQVSCFEWFFQSFLKVGRENYPSDLHVFVLFEFSSTDTDMEMESKRNELLRLCNNPPCFQLRDVTKSEVRSWIATFSEEEESPFIRTLKELLRRGKDKLPMLDIFDQFDDAIDKLPEKDRL